MNEETGMVPCVSSRPPVFDAVSSSMTWQGQTILELERSDYLPGFYGWFTLPGLPQPQVLSQDPGADSHNPSTEDL